MARIGVFLLTLFNIGGLIVGSVLNAAGSGSTTAGTITMIFGGIWVLAFTYASWSLCSKGQNDKGLLVAFLTWPVASAVGMAIRWGISTINNVTSDHTSNPEFEQVCKSAGVKYVAKPVSPVRSIAYDWEGSRDPGLNVIQLAPSGRIESSGYVMPRFPATIEFTEARCCSHVGAPTNGIGPFIRRPNGNTGEYFGVTALTADALVTYKISKAESSKADADFGQVDVTITDRRDGQLLGTLRYISDSKNKKMCGTTSMGMMDEAAFVRKAVGLD